MKQMARTAHIVQRKSTEKYDNNKWAWENADGEFIFIRARV